VSHGSAYPTRGRASMQGGVCENRPAVEKIRASTARLASSTMLAGR
jgi:hypothetical protein